MPRNLGINRPDAQDVSRARVADDEQVVYESIAKTGEKRGSMREQIERVITDLEELKEPPMRTYAISWCRGFNEGLESAISRLKDVLNEHEANHSRQTGPGSTDDAAEQV